MSSTFSAQTAARLRRPQTQSSLVCPRPYPLAVPARR